MSPLSTCSRLAAEGLKGYSVAKPEEVWEMSQRDKIGERLSTMLEQAAASAEGQTEVTLRNPQDEATKAQREAIEAQRKAAEASIASAKATEKAALAMERNAKLMLWSGAFAAISAVASAVATFWSVVHSR
jgi:hypothetical protein